MYLATVVGKMKFSGRYSGHQLGALYCLAQARLFFSLNSQSFSGACANKTPTISTCKNHANGAGLDDGPVVRGAGFRGNDEHAT